MKTLVRTAVLSLAAVLVTATVAQAQATRTWVSGVGDDANPCSRTAPCLTWAGAQPKTAAGGYIDALDNGDFGAVTITKSITLEGFSALAAMHVNGGAGIVVSAGASDVVTLRNLSVENTGTGTIGIAVTSVGSLYLEHVAITGFTGIGVNFNPGADSSRLSATDLTISDCGGTAVYVRSSRAFLERVFAGNNANGIVAGAGGVVSVKNSVISGSQMGLTAAYASSAVLTVQDSTVIGNLWGIVAGGGATVRVSSVSILDNNYAGLYNDGTGSIVSLGNNRLAGNAADGTFTSTVAIR